MKTGLFFGSFNPVHTGHLIIASYIADSTEFKKILFIVSPQNPMKPSSILLNEYHRLELVRLATEEDTRIEVSNVEFKMPRPSYTIDTLLYLKEKNPANEYGIIMGSDSLQNLPSWKNFEKIISSNTLLVYERPEVPIEKIYPNCLLMSDVPLLKISSSHIRALIRANKSIRYLVPEKVREEIEKYSYYKR